MAPRRFLYYLAESIDKAKLRQMATLMELTEEETKLLLFRFCDGLTIEQLAGFHAISPDRQRKLVPILEAKVMSWIEDHLEFFTTRQLKALNKWIPEK